VPFTPVEWWVGSALQLLAGILWAYIIGGLVGIVTAMNIKSEIFRGRIDEANNLISVFLEPEKEHCKKSQINITEGDQALAEKKKVARSIRRYIYTQAERPRSTCRGVSSLKEAYPVLETLSPALQRTSSLLIVQEYLDRIPYLSSRFLSTEERARVAEQCMVMELPCGEMVRLDENFTHSGRGILAQIKGLAVRSSRLQRVMPIVENGIFGDGTVLLEEDHPGAMTKVHFLSFSVVAFIPRDAVLSVLSKNSIAWQHARWKYMASSIVAKATLNLQDRNEPETNE